MIIEKAVALKTNKAQSFLLPGIEIHFLKTRQQNTIKDKSKMRLCTYKAAEQDAPLCPTSLSC